MNQRRTSSPTRIDPLERMQDGFRGNRSVLRRLIVSLRARGPEGWNRWRKEFPRLRPDLQGLDLSQRDGRPAELHGFDLRWARLAGAKLGGIRAWSARLDHADLRNADLDRADLTYATLASANLTSARLVNTNLTQTAAEGAIFRRANLSHAIINGADLRGADLRGARVTGLSTWGATLDSTTRQDGLILEAFHDVLEDLSGGDARRPARVIGRVDHVEAVGLLYLITNKEKLKTVIDAMTANLVLLLGNFGARRRAILRAVEAKLADLEYAPVIFDFEAPVDRDLIETVALLAGLSCFVIADLTRPRSTPLESMLVIPQLGVPFASIIEAGERPFSMFIDLQAKYDWVRPIVSYRSEEHLVRRVKTAIVDPCERMRAKLRRQREAARPRRIGRKRGRSAETPAAANP